MRPYPVFLRLEGRRVLLLGGSKVAAAKLPALIEAGARVTVVAPAICPELANPGVELRRGRSHLRISREPSSSWLPRRLR